MRTTIDLPDEIHELAKYLASSRDESLSSTIAALLAEKIGTESSSNGASRSVELDPASGLLMVAGGPVRTSAEVRALAYDE